jgi:hypothetical protein
VGVKNVVVDGCRILIGTDDVTTYIVHCLCLCLVW